VIDLFAGTGGLILPCKEVSTIKESYQHRARAKGKNLFFRKGDYEKSATEQKKRVNYDLNGNMVVDKNKEIKSIEYNHLNLPSKVTKNDDQYIKYIYDATGIKLAQEVYDASDVLQKRTDYIGEFIYENDALAIIQHEEGRLVPDPVSGNMTYEYAIRDHLGNTRLMFTSVPKTINFTLNYESDASNADDEALFKNVNKAAIKDFNSTTGDTNYDKSQILYSSLNSQVGSILAIPVGKGDQITATVNAKYFTAPANTGVGAGSIAASLITAFTSGATGVTEGGTSTINSNFGAGSVIGGAGFPYADVNAPKAFLNMMFLPEDESINFVNGSTFAYDQIADGSTEAIIDGISQNAFDVLTIEDFEATQNGYILVYVSNEGSLTDVYFDDMSVTVNESKIIQEASYYPFGLAFNNGYKRSTSKENKFLYNGKELQDDLELGLYDYEARYFDPAIARFINIDPAADNYQSWTPYHYVMNNPILFVDPTGMFTELFNENGKKIGEDKNGNDGNVSIITDKKESKRIAKDYKNGGVATADDVNGGFKTTKSVLTEAVNVLQRTEDNGGTHEESSLVMNDGSTVQGEQGAEGKIVKQGGFNFLEASTSVPDLPEGTTVADVASMIHSHLTKVIEKDGQAFQQDATKPSVGRGDQITFNTYSNNVIVGRLGPVKMVKQQDGSYKPKGAPLGAAFYKGSNLKPKLTLKKGSMQNIIK